MSNGTDLRQLLNEIAVPPVPLDSILRRGRRLRRRRSILGATASVVVVAIVIVIVGAVVSADPQLAPNEVTLPVMFTHAVPVPTSPDGTGLTTTPPLIIDVAEY
jgi:hypothetical protein